MSATDLARIGANAALDSGAALTDEQIGAIAARFFEGHAVAPAADFFVVAAEQDFGDGPAAEIGGSRVMRKFQEKGLRVGKRIPGRLATRRDSVWIAWLVTGFDEYLNEAEGKIERAWIFFGRSRPIGPRSDESRRPSIPNCDSETLP